MLTNLVVCATMATMSKSTKGVSAIGWIEVAASTDAVLSRIRWGTVAGRQGVVLKVIVPVL